MSTNEIQWLSTAEAAKYLGITQRTLYRFIDQGDFQGKRCMTTCSAGALLDQLRKEIRRANQISEFVYWDPNALYTDTKNDLANKSQLAARAIIGSE